MSNELARMDDLLVPQNLTTSQPGQDPDAMSAVTKAGAGWLPRLTLYQSSSNAVKSGQIGMAHWGISKRADAVDDDLGTTVDVLVISERPKAMAMVDGAPLSYYNFKSDEFKAVEVKADKEGFDGGCSYGPEMLLYIPSVNKYVTFYMASKSAKGAYMDLKARKGRAATCSSKFVKTQKYSWHVPVFTKCSTPFEMPNMEELTAFANDFNNPVDSQVEVVPEETGQAR